MGDGLKQGRRRRRLLVFESSGGEKGEGGENFKFWLGVTASFSNLACVGHAFTFFSFFLYCTSKKNK